MDDDFGADADFLALADAAERSAARSSGPSYSTTGSSAANKVVQPTPSSAGPSGSTSTLSSAATKVVQPTPRALPQRSGPSSIIVSTRQKGNPLLTHITALPWEYGDIPADYVLGVTSCALFLSLKYHRLHPEYIYSRIRALGRSYNLRILLATVDIDNHEEPLRELAKTSLVNDFTLMLCWSAREAARYLEAYRTLEFAAPAAIRGQVARGYSEQMVEFVTTPRGINRTDAVSLVGTFGSLRAAIGAPLEDIKQLQGWGDVKATRWHRVARTPFRRGNARARAGEGAERAYVPVGGLGARERERAEEQTGRAEGGESRREAPARASAAWEPGADEEEALLSAAAEAAAVAPASAAAAAPGRDEAAASVSTGAGAATTSPIAAASTKRSRPEEPALDAGVAAALAKYRKA